jgi:anaerobic magnesium-protoporphyrin IX monomethyl ester cyclase
LLKKPKVLMVIPNQRWVRLAEWSIHPYSVCLLIAIIKDQCGVGFLDANIDDLTIEETENKIANFVPDIVGVSVLADSYRNSGFNVCEIAKRVVPKVITVMGGVFPTTRPEKAMECHYVDYVVIGEGEKTFPQLIQYIVGNDKIPDEGIAFRNGNKIEIRPQKNFINDLDALPMPDYSVLDFSKYSMNFKKEPQAPRVLPYGKILTSRGCPINCVFCEVKSISGMKIRAKSPERVISEIETLINDYGIKSLEFMDDQLLGKVDRFKEILRLMIKKNWDLEWMADNVSVFYIDEEMIDLMKSTKCFYLSLAVESGSPRVLKDIIKKPVKLDHVKRIADYARKNGIDTCSLFVIGFPGETWNEIRQTIKFAEDLGTDYVKINIASPFRGTDLYDLAKSTNTIIPDVDFDDIDWCKAVISTDEFTPDQLTILRAMEWDRINFTSVQKRGKVASMMRVTMEELDKIRHKTIDLTLSD